MSADLFLQYLTQALFVLITLVVVAQAVRHPTRAKVDIALFFGVTALVIAEGWAFAALGITAGAALRALNGSLVMALPYLLLRLVSDFAAVPSRTLRAAEVGLVFSVVSLFAFRPSLPVPLVLLLVGYFCAFSIYAALAFFRQARRSSGVTRRRMEAVAAGSTCLGLGILGAGVVSGLGRAAPDAAELVNVVLVRPLNLAAGVGYFIGFAPPAVLRRAWQEPELRAFLGRAASLPRLPDTDAIVRELTRGAAASLGAPRATVGLWDEAGGVLRYAAEHESITYPDDRLIGGRAFTAQRPIFTEDAARDDPEGAAIYRDRNVTAVLAAPITAGEKRLGVLLVYAPRAPIFADEDLRLVQLLADQAAVILESRALIDEAARVRAREEATRLKDDFLSAAAHDLKTPLTTLVALGQLLERRALRNPAAPADLKSIQRLVGEANRLKDLVLELLDASRVEQGRIVDRREAVDLATLAREVCGRHPADRHRIVLRADGPVVGAYDQTRIGQLIENLLENAVKYSPDEGEVEVRVWREDGRACLTVTDRGIGIPPADLPHIFERFHRASNVDDRRFAGMGLGLYICRGIVEQHDGRIWAASAPGEGSTFHVALPAAAAAVAAIASPADGKDVSETCIQ